MLLRYSADEYATVSSRQRIITLHGLGSLQNRQPHSPRTFGLKLFHLSDRVEERSDRLSLHGRHFDLQPRQIVAHLRSNGQPGLGVDPAQALQGCGGFRGPALRAECAPDDRRPTRVLVPALHANHCHDEVQATLSGQSLRLLEKQRDAFQQRRLATTQVPQIAHRPLFRALASPFKHSHWFRKLPRRCRIAQGLLHLTKQELGEDVPCALTATHLRFLLCLGFRLRATVLQVSLLAAQQLRLHVFLLGGCLHLLQ
mmetsp:Transcript_119436/g.380963  ORF Transcript_119436/g.380963 Transcript_119436/m.380963 type:complete len:256 (-) Transcript_119436:1045-1812(-)